MCTFAASLCLAPLAAAQTRLHALGHSAHVDLELQVVRFEIFFNLEPDFFTLDPQGRQADSFQFHLDTMPGHQGMYGSSPFPWETIVRGEEVHLNSLIPIRDHICGPSTAPGSGGWGSILGSVPYTLADTFQTFEAPFPMLNTTTGDFRYRLELYHYGTLTQLYRGLSSPMPEPGAAAGLLAAAWWLRRRRRPDNVIR